MVLPHRHHGVIGDRVAGENVLALGQQVPPVLVSRRFRWAHAQPPPGGIPVGEQVEAAVPAHRTPGLGIHALLHGPQGAVAAEVAQVQVVAGGGAQGHADAQPAPVVGCLHPEVRRLVHPLAEEQLVVGAGGTQAVAPHAAVELLLSRRHPLVGEPGHVDQLLAPGQPGHVGPPAEQDGAVDNGPGGGVHHVQHAFLPAPLGGDVGHPVPLLGDPHQVEGGGETGIDGRRVDEHLLAAVLARYHQDGMFLPRLAAPEERPAPDHGGQTDHPREQRLQPRPQRVPSRHRVEHAPHQDVLLLAPALGAGIVHVLQPAIRIGHRVPVEHLHQVEPLGPRVCHGTR